MHQLFSQNSQFVNSYSANDGTDKAIYAKLLLKGSAKPVINFEECKCSCE